MEIITTHLNADFDGLASMVAARKLYPGAALVLPAGAQESVRSFLGVHDVGLARLKDIEVAQVTRLILVDTHEPARLGPLEPLCRRAGLSIHVYDHHPASEPGREGPALRADFSLREPVGATVTLLIERLRERRLSLSPFEASVLAIGLYEETGSLAYASTTPRDLEAAAWLVRSGADLALVSATLRHPLDPDQIAILNDLLQQGETRYLDGRKVLLAASIFDRYRGDLDEVVQKLAELEGFDAVLAAVAMEDKVEIVGRSRRPEIDVGAILREFGGGGHAAAAAASVKGRTLVEVRERLAHLLEERFRPTLLARDVMTKPVKAVGDEATVADAESRMTQYGVNVLPVLDGRERFLGVMTRESVQKALFHGFAKKPVGDFVQTGLYRAAPETPFHEIERQMVERNQRFVPVLAGPVSAPTVVGVITRTDLLRALHDDVLASAKAKAKGAEVAGQAPPARRNIRSLLHERLNGELYRLLEEAGRLADRLDVSLFAVGGFVRDLLLGRDNQDVDVVVEGDGIAFARALAAQTGGSVKAHDRFGTAVVTLPSGAKVDVATARTEYYEYPTALPTVERSSIKQDLYRRDFTINTLAVRLNGRTFGDLVDCYGGQRDLHDKAIRVLHSLSFIEDPTRVFRAVRFEQRFGFRLGKETVALIKGAVKMDLFHRLSGHRLLEELRLLLSESHPSDAVRRLGELDLLRFIHPRLAWSGRAAKLLGSAEEVLDWYAIAALAWPEGKRVTPWLVYAMALLDSLPARAMEDTVKRLAPPAPVAQALRDGRLAGALLRRLAGRPAPALVYRLLCCLSEEVLVLALAKAGTESAKRRLVSFLERDRWVKPAVTGADLKVLGLKPGPKYAQILKRLLDARLNGEVTTEQGERALAARLAAPLSRDAPSVR